MNTYADYGRLKNEVDLLIGNINRMCVTTDEKELEDMRDWAKRRIDTLFNIRKGNADGGRKEL